MSEEGCESESERESETEGERERAEGQTLGVLDTKEKKEFIGAKTVKKP